MRFFGLAFQTNAIPVRDIDAFGTGYNYVAAANDLSDLFQGSPGNNGPGMLSIALDANMAHAYRWPAFPVISYHVEGSTDLRNWVNLVPVVAGTNGLLQFVDTNFSLYPKRFYRVGP